MPSRDRLSLLAAAVRQWQSHAAQIIVVDGSERECTSEFMGMANVCYIHDSSSIELRLVRAVGIVGTNFVMLQSDDNIFVPEAVAAAGVHLRANHEH